VTPPSEHFYQKDWNRPKPPKYINNYYCYKTLADVVCYEKPLKGQEHRLVSSKGTLLEESVSDSFFFQ
jgi:hypothetical protein